MTSESKQNEPGKKEQADVSTLMRQFGDQLSNWLKDSNPEIHSRVEVALDSLGQLAGLGWEGAKATTELLNEFAHDLTGIESFRVIPKSSMALEVDIRCRHEQDLVVKQPLAPFVELYALHLGRRVHFEGLWNKERKGLQLDINEGMSLKVQAPIVGMQTVEIKGSGLLTRDEQKRPVLVVTSKIPGLDSPVTVSVPLNHFISGVQSHIKKKFTRHD
jgi:hypothetical protein